jgi:hypothetical protein
MNKNMIVIGAVIVLVGIGGVSLYINHNNSNTASNAATTNTAVVTQPVQTSPATVAAATTALAVPLMQSTGQKFSQYAYVSKAHEVYPTLAADTTKALGAFSFAKTSLGNGEYRITLTNNAEGYKGQSVVVGAGQSVYFIERSTGDDSAAEDSVTTDDILVAVDAQGNILK